MAGTPTRIDQDVLDAAKVAAAAMSRSQAAQVSHWARLGRELELSKQLRVSDVRDVLTGAASYDSLGAREQAVVRAEWSERIEALRAGDNLEEEFLAAGRTWSELDAEGNVVERNAV
jgi:hypothetical protein